MHYHHIAMHFILKIRPFKYVSFCLRKNEYQCKKKFKTKKKTKSNKSSQCQFYGVPTSMANYKPKPNWIQLIAFEQTMKSKNVKWRGICLFFCCVRACRVTNDVVWNSLFARFSETEFFKRKSTDSNQLGACCFRY